MKNILPYQQAMKRCVLRVTRYAVAFGQRLRHENIISIVKIIVAAGIPAGPRIPQHRTPQRFFSPRRTPHLATSHPAPFIKSFP
jgi:hypothetical protein